MPIEKQKPSSSVKAQPAKKTPRSSELGEDDLRRVTGGMTSGDSTGASTPVCISQT